MAKVFCAGPRQTRSSSDTSGRVESFTILRLLDNSWACRSPMPIPEEPTKKLFLPNNFVVSGRAHTVRSWFCQLDNLIVVSSFGGFCPDYFRQRWLCPPRFSSGFLGFVCGHFTLMLLTPECKKGPRISQY